MKWTADAAVLQNVDFSSQFVKWIRDGTALCQTKVATDHPLNRIMKQLQPIVAMMLVSQKLSTVGYFACAKISWVVVALLVLLFACWVFVVVVVVGWVLGATRGTQLTYSQIRSVWGTICMRRSCKSGLKSEQEELELSSRIQNEERPLAGSHLLLPPHQDLRALIWKMNVQQILKKIWERKELNGPAAPAHKTAPATIHFGWEEISLKCGRQLNKGHRKWYGSIN